MSHENGRDKEWGFRIREKVEEANEVDFLAGLRVVVVPGHEVDHCKSAHE